MRTISVVVSDAIACDGSDDSAATTVTISAPVSENTMPVTPASTATAPNGANPPCATRLPSVDPVGDVKPSA